MAIASKSRRQVGFIAESTFGTTPATPDIQLIEFTSFAPKLDTQLVKDDSRRPDRQTSYARFGNVAVKGDLEVNMCATSYDAFIEAALMGTWTTNVLKIGTSKKSFAVEEGFTDLSQYRVYNGMMVDTLTLDATSGNKFVTGKFGFLGASETPFGATVDATPQAALQKPKFFHANATIKEGGTTVGYVTSFNLTLKNGLSAAYGIGNGNVRDIGYDVVEVSGKITAFFEDVTLYNKFKNGTASSFEFTLSDGTNSQTWLIPNLRYVSADVKESDSFFVVELDYQALYDSTNASSLKVTRV